MHTRMRRSEGRCEVVVMRAEAVGGGGGDEKQRTAAVLRLKEEEMQRKCIDAHVGRFERLNGLCSPVLITTPTIHHLHSPTLTAAAAPPPLYSSTGTASATVNACAVRAAFNTAAPYTVSGSALSEHALFNTPVLQPPSPYLHRVWRHFSGTSHCAQPSYLSLLSPPSPPPLLSALDVRGSAAEAADGEGRLGR